MSIYDFYIGVLVDTYNLVINGILNIFSNYANYLNKILL